MKYLKILSICFTFLFVQNGYSQNENLGAEKLLTFKQQVENKFIEVKFKARPGEFLAGETYFHFKLEDIIIHTWEFDGKLYDKNNSNGVLPVSGKMGFIYADVKIKTINNAPNEYWEKTGFQIQKITSFEDIPYEGKRDNHFWITYAHVSDCKIGSVYIEDWMELQKRIKGEKVNSSKNSSSNNSNVENSNTANNSNTDKELEKINKILNDPNFTANNPQLIQQVSNLILQTDFDNEASVNKYIEDVQKIVSNYIGITNEPQNKISQNNNSNTSKIEQVAKEMNLRSDEVEILEIFNDSKNINEAYSKLKEKNIQSLNKYTLDALNKIVGTNNDFSISGSDIQTLLNGGSLTDVLKNVNVKNANKIAQGLGLDANQTQVLNIIASSGSKEEMTKRLNEHNIQQINQLTANGLNKLLGDSYGNLPISSGDVSSMLNGDIKSVLRDYNNNQNIIAVQEATGLGAGESELLIGATEQLFSNLYANMERREAEKAEQLAKSVNEFKDYLKSIDRIKEFQNEDGTYTSKKPFEYIGNFSDNNWENIENNFTEVTHLNNNEIEVKITKDIDFKDLRVDDHHILSFENQNFNVGKDFEISFEYGFDIKNKSHNKWRVPFTIFTSNHTVFRVGNLISYYNYSFTPYSNLSFWYSRSDFQNKIFENAETDIFQFTKEHNNVISLELFKKNPEKRAFFKYSKEEQKLFLGEKDILQSVSKSLDKKIKSKEEPNYWIYNKIRIVKENENVIFYFETIDENFNKRELRSQIFPFKYINENKIFFGINALMVDNTKDVKFRIKNFTIKQ